MPHRCSVSGECCATCSELQHIQSKIHVCQELLEKLYIQEAHIKFSVNASHDSLICRLSLELVSIIFTLTVADEVGGDSFGHELYYGFPQPRYQFSLAGVSKSWRQIVMSTPQLWTNIRIQLHFDLLSHSAELLRLSLEFFFFFYNSADSPFVAEPYGRVVTNYVCLMVCLHEASGHPTKQQLERTGCDLERCENRRLCE